MIETSTVRIAYSWTERNQVQLLHYGPKMWETGVDEDGALEAACSGLAGAGISITETPYEAPENMEVRNPFTAPIDFSVCKNCGRPIFFDWKGAHHVKESHSLPAMIAGILCDYSNPECGKPEEEAEDVIMPEKEDEQ